MQTYKHIGTKIRALRESKGFTETDFAQRCEISLTYLGLIENGRKYNITLGKLYKIAAELGVEPASLLDFSDVETIQSKESELITLTEVKVILGENYQSILDSNIVLVYSPQNGRKKYKRSEIENIAKQLRLA